MSAIEVCLVTLAPFIVRFVSEVLLSNPSRQCICQGEGDDLLDKNAVEMR